MFRRFLELPRFLKRIISVLADLIAMTIALWLAFSVYSEALFVPDSLKYVVLSGSTAAATILVFIRVGLYRAVIRFLSDRTILTISAGALASVAALVLFSQILELPVPWAVCLLYGTLTFLFVGATRLGVRMFIRHPERRHKELVGIVGVGETGRQLVSALFGGTEYHPAAIFTVDASAHRTLIAGVPVYDIAHADRVVRELDLRRLLLAIDSSSPYSRQQILNRLEPLTIPVQAVPSVSGLISGRLGATDIRDLEVEDLLGRDPVSVDRSLLKEALGGRSVMVTGAGGSIGSELCRQILSERPSTLVIFEQSEYALYSIEQELNAICQREGMDVQIRPILGSVLHRRRCASIMTRFQVQVVYHAAAYKHVPLVESNVIEGVQNNVFGTWYAAEAAIDAGVERFVLISTDKAVRPTSVMGASKRLAELVLQGLALRVEASADGAAACPVFTMVRFGNVLDSSGSVVPLFRKQIREGGPVTVTHPQITRYFMTIPEAAQLVLQAGAMGSGGEVFVLDMGQPVRIADLAKKMIHLMGLTEKTPANASGDVEVIYSGLRPGEKLFEELVIGEDPRGTSHPRIMMALESSVPWKQLQLLLESLDTASHRFETPRVVQILADAPVGFDPSGREDWVAGSGNVVDEALVVSERIHNLDNVRRLKAASSTPQRAAD